MLSAFAKRLDNRPLERHVFFFFFTLVIVSLYGSHLGTFDQAIHIPFLKKAVDPSLYPGDAFAEMRLQNFSFFWRFFEIPLRAGVLEPVLFIGQFFATYCTFWAAWDLSKTLFSNALSALLTVVAFAFPHLGISGFTLIEWSLLNRTFVLPFLLWSIILFLRKRYALAFLVLGLLYNLHVISVNFPLAMFGLVCLVRFREFGWQRLTGYAGLFLIGAAPVLVWRFAMPPATIIADPQWLNVIDLGAFYHLFHLFAPFPAIMLLTLGGFSSFILFGIMRRRNPAPKYDQTITIFMAALAILILIQVVNEWFIPIAIINQLQIFRAGEFVIIFCYLYLVNGLVQKYQSKHMAGWDFAVQSVTTLFTITPLAPLTAYAIYRYTHRVSWRRAAVVTLTSALFAVSIVISLMMDFWSPGFPIYGRQDAWFEAQTWAKDNTPKDTIFVTPPEIWGFYTSDWRVFSERSTVATWSELLEIALVPSHFPYWEKRFERVAPGAIEQFRGDYFENYRVMRQSYYSLTSADFQALGRDYSATYAVLEKPQTRDLPMVYENEKFTIYSLR